MERLVLSAVRPITISRHLFVAPEAETCVECGHRMQPRDSVTSFGSVYSGVKVGKSHFVPVVLLGR
jgi:hypothetical protein